MKILIISNMYPSLKDPVYGTFVELFVKQISELNEKRNTLFIVIKGREGNRAIKVWKYIKFYFSIVFVLLSQKFDLIYIHTITYPIPPIRIVRLFKKLPLVFNVHGGDVLTRGKIATVLKEQSIPLLKEAKLVVSPSHFFKKVLLQEFPFLDSNKIYISPSGGVDSSFYAEIPQKRNECFSIGYVSRIDEAKGWDIFINAIANLKVKGYNIHAYIVGRGKQTKEMKNMIINLSLSDYIDYLGPIPYNDLPQIYSSLDLFVFPTQLEESLGLVGLEAMANSIPVIGSRIGGLTDYIKDNENGLFFNVGDSNDLSRKIEQYILLTPNEKQAFRKSAYETACLYSSEITKNNLYLKLKTIV